MSENVMGVFDSHCIRVMELVAACGPWTWEPTWRHTLQPSRFIDLRSAYIIQYTHARTSPIHLTFDPTRLDQSVKLQPGETNLSR